MAAGRKEQQQGAVVAAAPSVARRMWRVLRAVLYMLRRGLPSGRKLAMDLHLFLARGKIAGKALGDLLAFHHPHNNHQRRAYATAANSSGGSSSFSCRELDPALAVHEPSWRARREVEFSCSNTPSDFGKRSGRRRDEGYLHYCNYDAAEVARLFELLNDDGGVVFADDDEQHAAYATPSPAQLLWVFARSPAVSRQLRLAAAESPAPSIGSSSKDAAEDGGAQVDRRADEFIRRFYEQLRAQRSAASTPDYYGASPYVSSSRRTPRAIAAGIA